MKPWLGHKRKEFATLQIRQELGQKMQVRRLPYRQLVENGRARLQTLPEQHGLFD
jgi:hypothetical protein